MNKQHHSSALAICVTLCLAIGSTTAIAAGKSGNRQVPSGIDNANGPVTAKKPRWTLEDYESVAAKTIVAPPGYTYFSRCRRAPFEVTNLYPVFAGGESDAIVGDTTFPLVDGKTCYNPQNEHNVVINPTNSNNIVASANEYRLDGHAVYYSKDGGATWANVALPGWTSSTGGSGVFSTIESCGDPVLAFSPDGKRLYYTGLVCAFSGQGNLRQVKSGVAVAVSTDGGATWSAPSMAAYKASGNYFQDKQWMTVGPDGTVHVTWTEFKITANGKFGESNIVIASSKDGGKSWSGTKPVSDAVHPYNQGSMPQVGPDGTIYVSYIGATPDSDYWTDAAILAISKDGGKSFSNREVARIYDDLDCYPRQVIGQGRQTLTGMQFRINSFPNMSVDPVTGAIAMVWADNEGRGNCGGDLEFEYDNSEPTSNQVKLIRSTDGGATWSAPRVITASDATDKVYPAVAANNDKVVVGYYTRKYSTEVGADYRCGVAYLSADGNTVLGDDDIGPVCLDYAVRHSGDDFAAETRLSSVSSNPYILFSGSFIGDYTGVALDGSGKAAAVWTDFRGNPGITRPNQDAVVHTFFVP